MRKISIAFFFLSLFYNLSFSTVSISPDLQAEIAQKGKALVIIGLKDSSPAILALKFKKPLISQLQNQFLALVNLPDFELKYQYKTIPFVAGYINQTGLEKALAYPVVSSIALDQPVKAFLAESIPLVKADSVHSLGYTGKNCRIAILDTGIDTDHPDVGSAVVGQFHFLPSGNGPGAEDDHGHGTTVAGVVASDGVVASVGMAPDAEIVAVKVLDSTGSGTLANIVAGIDWVTANQDTLQVKAMNMSLGSREFLDTGYCDDNGVYGSYTSAISQARASGIAVFVASGNGAALNGISAPGCISYSISVGAVYDSSMSAWHTPNCDDTLTDPDIICCFTNRNRTLDLLAPGAAIVSSTLGGGKNSLPGTWGTSFATPHAAGLALLMCEINPCLSPDSIEKIMKETGIPVYDSLTGLTFPRINSKAAVLAVPLNSAPVLDPFTADSVRENSSLSFRIHFSDPDICLASISGLNLPTNASVFDSGNGSAVFTFNPDTSQAGFYNLIFAASDGVLADTDSVSIEVLNCGFRAGDVNGDGKYTLPDIISEVNIVFKGAAKPAPACRTDANADDKSSLPDIIILVNKVFKGGPTPPPIGVCCL